MSALTASKRQRLAAGLAIAALISVPAPTATAAAEVVEFPEQNMVSVASIIDLLTCREQSRIPWCK
ncbi:hypothetical protein [Corynebacterium alimapuense]|uniref:Uncharacterized protein n=1 Tax=Corynebacterium alimapuense TaxID=1576874 RepID=A0A3M8K503_9CORY|nr:hypothetical protein [Corynebacterium alimapuense]RNE48180.1 hypothetical protein C5L39_09960 [Corynebacterium alimapuense]